MPITGVIPEPAVTKRNLPPRRGQDELAGGLLEVDQRAGARLADQVVADDPVGDGLDRDRDLPVARGGRG